MQEFFIGGDIGHRFAIMGIADIASGIDHAVQRHAPQLEDIDLLPVGSRYRVVGVRQADEGDTLIPPILLEDGRWVGPHSKNLNAAAGKFFVFISQARQLRAAVRSHETAQEREHNGLPTEIG